MDIRANQKTTETAANQASVHETARQKVDPITFEVVRYRLLSIVDEQAATLAAISGSPLVNEATDYNAGIFRAHGETVAIGKTVLFHAASVGEMIKHIIADCEQSPGIRPGDMFLVNHPYKGSLHPPDIGLVAPVFHDNKRIAWVGLCCHQLDVGGMAPGGSFPEAREVIQEGTLISPLRAVENGEFRTDILNMILGMSRMPTNMNLDFRGMLAANHVAIKRIQETIEQYGVDTVLSVMDEANDVTEQALRTRIRALPDGIYRAQTFLDHDGRQNKLYRIHVTLTKKDDQLIFDYSESAPQSPGFMNCTHSGLLAGVRAAILPILAYDLPWNEGVFRAIEVVAKPGSIVSATFPAPVSQGPLGAVWLAENVATAALSKLVANTADYLSEAQASPNGGPDNFTFHGRNQYGEIFHAAFLDQIYVGGGAYSHRDGLSPQGHRHMPAIRLTNVERNEQNGPVLYLHRRLLADMGGPGRFRGGISAGVAIVLHHVDKMQMRMACHCYESPTSTGLFGGYPAACNRRTFLKDTNWKSILANSGHMPFEASEIDGKLLTFPAKMLAEVEFSANDVYQSSPSAGAGWGDPLDREPQSVIEDVHSGAVSTTMARVAYGVLVTQEGLLDLEGTRALRSEIRNRRLAWPIAKSIAVEIPLAASGEVIGLYGDVATTEKIDSKNYFRCKCGCAFAPAEENWKDYARSAKIEAADLGPMITLHEELEVMQFACPHCAKLLDTEVKLRGERPLFDVQIDFA